jgi:hypothetical protein
MKPKKVALAFSIFIITVFSQNLFAQGLNWEGQTGVLLTPFAYTAGTPAGKFAKPEVAFHYLNAGNVIGNEYQFSVTEGVARRFELGFTQSLSSSGSIGIGGKVSSSGVTNPPSYLFNGGFSAIHGKLMILPENAFKTQWFPAIAVGAIGRFGDERVNWAVTEKGPWSPSSTNGDFYIVATKTVAKWKLPFVLSLGDKVTNASELGIFGEAGNALNAGQRWQGRFFGAAAIVVKGPAKSALILGSEALQEPKYVQPLGAAAHIPTSLSYFVRVVPHMEGSRLQFDLGIVQAAGKIVNIPGREVLDLNARARVGTGISYHF